jgi:hypothetical protein
MKSYHGIVPDQRVLLLENFTVPKLAEDEIVIRMHTTMRKLTRKYPFITSSMVQSAETCQFSV